jgi:hypothetical protein
MRSTAIGLVPGDPGRGLERLRGGLFGYLPLRVRPGVEQAGGVEYLVLLAQEAPKTFVPLLIKTMPPEPKVPQEGGLNIHIDLTFGGGWPGRHLPSGMTRPTFSPLLL